MNSEPVEDAIPCLPVEEDTVLLAPWFLDSDGSPREIRIRAGDECHYDQEGEVLHVRRPGYALTITPQLEVLIVEQPDEWTVEFRAIDPDKLQGPSVFVTAEMITIDDAGFNFKQSALFAKACEIMRTPMFNPYGVLPPNGNVGGYQCDFKTGDISYADGSGIDEAPPQAPQWVRLRQTRELQAKNRNDGPATIPPGRYEVKPSIVDRQTGQVQFWMFKGLDNENILVDKVFVADDALAAEIEGSHAIILALEERQDLDHPFYRLAAKADAGKPAAKSGGRQGKVRRPGLLGRLLGKS